jgi:hypothetical protein
MSKPELFRNYAADCLRLAHAIHDPVNKARLVEMAAAWQRLVDRGERMNKEQSPDAVEEASVDLLLGARSDRRASGSSPLS